MIRVVAAAILANLAAPCLFFIMAGLRTVLSRPDVASSGQEMAFPLALVLFRIAVLLVFTTVFPVSLALALAGRFLGWRSPWTYSIGGALIGLGFVFFGYGWDLPDAAIDRTFFAMGVSIGGICGWIYWAIALRQRRSGIAGKRGLDP